MGGGPSQAQNDAASSQAQLNGELGAAFKQNEAFKEAQQAKVNPFYTQMMAQGNPYFANQTDALSGNTAAGFAPAKAQLEQSLGRQSGLPSGFATGARTDLASNQARAFDQQLSGAQAGNFAAKQAGASGLLGQAQIANPNAYAQTATQGNSSIMNAPLASPGLGGLLGGMAGGLASAIAF